MPPRILFVDQSAEIGGAELSLLDIARHHAANATVVLFRPGPFQALLERSGVTTALLEVGPDLLNIRRDAGALWRTVPSLLAATSRLVRLGRGHDLLYANTQKAFVVAALAGAWLRRPVVWHLRDILSAEHFGTTQLRLVTALARLPHVRVIANSEATAAAFRAAGGGRGALTVIANGLDPAAYTPPLVPAPGDLRRELGLSADLPVVGLFGRLAEWKGQHVLLAALGRLNGVQGLIVGDALFGEDAYRNRLHEVAARTGFGQRVRFTGFRSDVPALMGICDLVVHTSTAPEPFGRVIVEAMLAGKPVIAADAGGAAEIVEHGHNGVLITPGDAEALADWIRHLLDDRELADELAANGRRHAIATYGLERMLAAVDGVVAAAVPDAGRGPKPAWTADRAVPGRSH